ncbi:MAG: 5-(carboxyamino)imidazole ribonucleotide synthase [Oscillospiraceae bacterium]|nr:5-(carboxyamino)imidazole ribonucleotide synthase [Oscillospiraceae bacterium]
MSVTNKRIGIIGGGQLGKMMILEAKRLGFHVIVLDPAADCPCSSVCDELIVASLNDGDAILALAKKVDVVTYEFEHINADALEKAELAGVPVYPSVASLKKIQNKYIQKSVLQEKGIAVPRLSEEFNADFGFPQMFKSKKGGYDGKGNWVIKQKSDIPTDVDGFFEEWVDYELEVSVIACRAINGEVVVYPIGENIHSNSILDTTIVPARIDGQIKIKAMEVANQVMNVFEGVGTFGVEMFVCKNGDVLVNEVAPRPHNSGHYTIEGCFANQFENHIRAIVGLPFGEVSLIYPTVMVNLLGVESDGKANLVGLEEAYKFTPKVNVHIYGKSESKIYRKMGHYTVVDCDLEKAISVAEKLKGIVKVVGVL